MNSIQTDNTNKITNNTPIVDKTKPITDELRYIGDDGKLYSTPKALEEANKIYWKNWKKINASGEMRDLSHLRALDGSYHSNPESIKEANRRFRETCTEQIDNINSQRTELLNQLLANPKYALDCAGLKFIKQIYEIDPRLIQEMLELILAATKNGDFENLETKFIDMIATMTDIQKTSGKLR